MKRRDLLKSVLVVPFMGLLTKEKSICSKRSGTRPATKEETDKEISRMCNTIDKDNVIRFLYLPDCYAAYLIQRDGTIKMIEYVDFYNVKFGEIAK